MSKRDRYVPARSPVNLIVTVFENSFNFTSLSSRAVRREAKSSYRPSSPHAGRPDIRRIELGICEVAKFQVSLVHVGWSETIVTCRYQSIVQGFKHFIRFLVAQSRTTGHDVRMAGVINSCLDSHVERVSTRRAF